MTLQDFITAKTLELTAYYISCGEREIVPYDAEREEWETDFEEWRSEI